MYTYNTVIKFISSVFDIPNIHNYSYHCSIMGDPSMLAFCLFVCLFVLLFYLLQTTYVLFIKLFYQFCYIKIAQ